MRESLAFSGVSEVLRRKSEQLKERPGYGERAAESDRESATGRVRSNFRLRSWRPGATNVLDVSKRKLSMSLQTSHWYLTQFQLQSLFHEEVAYANPNDHRNDDHQVVVGHIGIVQAERIQNVARRSIPKIVELFHLFRTEVIHCDHKVGDL